MDSHNPLSESKTSFASDVKNSLNTPPPSIPALGTRLSALALPKTEVDVLLLTELINEHDFQRLFQVHFLKSIESILCNLIPPDHRFGSPTAMPIQSTQ